MRTPCSVDCAETPTGHPSSAIEKTRARPAFGGADHRIRPGLILDSLDILVCRHVACGRSVTGRLREATENTAAIVNPTMAVI